MLIRICLNSNLVELDDVVYAFIYIKKSTITKYLEE